MTGFMSTIAKIYLFLCLVLNIVYAVGMMKVGKGLEVYLLTQLAVLCAITLVPYQVKVKINVEKKRPGA